MKAPNPAEMDRFEKQAFYRRMICLWVTVKPDAYSTEEDCVKPNESGFITGMKEDSYFGWVVEITHRNTSKSCRYPICDVELREGGYPQ